MRASCLLKEGLHPNPSWVRGSPYIYVVVYTFSIFYSFNYSSSLLQHVQRAKQKGIHLYKKESPSIRKLHADLSITFESVVSNIQRFGLFVNFHV